MLENSTCSQCPWPIVDYDYGQIGIAFMHVVTMIISLCGHSLLLSIIFNGKKRFSEEATYRLIGSVSAADLCMTVFSQVFHIYFLLTGFSEANLEVQMIFHACVWGFGGASAFGVVCVTLDRFLYIMYPLHYHEMLTTKRTILLVTIQWTCGLAYGILPMVNIEKSSQATSVASIVTLFAITICMVSVYKYVYREASLMKRTRMKTKIKKSSQVNATFTVFLIVLIFFICWFPYLLLNLIKSLHIYNGTFFTTSFFWCLALAMWNSSFNVFIYGLKNRTLKREIRIFFGKRKISIAPAILSINPTSLRFTRRFSFDSTHDSSYSFRSNSGKLPSDSIKLKHFTNSDESLQNQPIMENDVITQGGVILMK